MYGQPSDAAGNAAAILIGITALIGWAIPVIIAIARKVPTVGAVIVIDLLLGWTIIGWIVALAMACGSNRPRQPYPPQWQAPPPGWQGPPR